MKLFTAEDARKEVTLSRTRFGAKERREFRKILKWIKESAQEGYSALGYYEIVGGALYSSVTEKLKALGYKIDDGVIR